MKATIAILTYNAEPWLRDVLNACLNQKADFDFEVLIIDSGSTDQSLEIIRDYGTKIRLHEIPNSEFGHGKTRNLAAKLAKGDIVVFLTQDAQPANEHWLTQMLLPFELSKDIVCVYGKQIPRADCCPTVKRDVISTFAGFGPDHFTMIQRANSSLTDQAAIDANTFFSDVNSAVRKKLLLGDIPYRDLDYSEDYALGKDVIEAGLAKAYAPLAAVIHSHSYPLVKYFRRMYDEMNGMKKATGRTLDTSLLRHVLIIARGTIQDWRFVLRDSSYRLPEKLKWLIQVPFYNLARRVAVRLAAKNNVPAWARHYFSLEAQTKK